MKLSFEESEFIVIVCQSMIESESQSEEDHMELLGRAMALEVLLIISNGCIRAAIDRTEVCECSMTEKQIGFLSAILEPVAEIAPDGIIEKLQAEAA